jgi:hypothetical protein
MTCEYPLSYAKVSSHIETEYERKVVTNQHVRQT